MKIWVDDRRGTYPKMTPEVYNAIIDEAHSHGMLVHAHAIQLADQKAVVRAGADVLVHTVADREARRRAARAGAREEAVLDDRASGSAIAARRAITIRSSIESLPGDARWKTIHAGELRAAARRTRPTREEMLANNVPEDGRRGRAARARHRCRHRRAPRVRLGGPPRDGALGGARIDPRRRSSPRRRVRRRCSGWRTWARSRRQERRLHRARREPARGHPQHTSDRQRVPARLGSESRRAGRKVQVGCGLSRQAGWRASCF